MLSTDFLGGLRGPDRLPDWLRSTGCALLYWLVFLLALEPGNVLHARSMGHALDFDDEALRIGCAALLGCSTAPLILAMSRRFPICGPRGWRSIADSCSKCRHAVLRADRDFVRTRGVGTDRTGRSLG